MTTARGSGGRLNVPGSLVPHHRVRVWQQLAHTCDQRYLPGFALLKYRLQRWIPPHRRHCSHVEHLTDLSSPTPNRPVTTGLAAVPVQWGNSCEVSYPLPGERAQRRELGEQHQHQHRQGPQGRRQERVRGLRLRILLHSVLEGLVEPLSALYEVRGDLFEITPYARPSCCAEGSAPLSGGEPRDVEGPTIDLFCVFRTVSREMLSTTPSCTR